MKSIFIINRDQKIKKFKRIEWTEKQLPSVVNLFHLCWSPELKLFCTLVFGENKALTSPDGVTWTQRQLPVKAYWQGICWSKELGLFAAGSGANNLVTSPDGINWTQRTSPIANVTYSKIIYVPELNNFFAAS